jgi:glycosyltransferase involved in cell wall biosynthesis
LLLRIAFITYEYPPETAAGGIGTYTRQVAGLLATNNVDVHVFAGSLFQCSTNVENGIKVHRVFCKGPQDFQKNVVDVFQQHHILSPFQLIESAEIHANALLIKKMFPELPLIVRLHASNWLVENMKKKYMPLQNKLRFFIGALRRGRWDLGYWRKYEPAKDEDYLFVKQADYITAPSNQMKDWVCTHWKVNPSQIQVLENPFVEKELFKTARTNNEEQAVIFYGRLNVLKGLITATKAMKHILNSNPGWKWIIVGEDGAAADGRISMKKWMEKQLNEVNSQVNFHETVSHIHLASYLKQVSIVLVPSLFESYSYVTIEAMSAGKAVVGSDGTAIASLINKDVSGKLVNPYSVKDWKNVIQELINDKNLRKHLGIAAIQYVEEKNRINEDIITFYKKISFIK